MYIKLLFGCAFQYLLPSINDNDSRLLNLFFLFFFGLHDRVRPNVGGGGKLHRLDRFGRRPPHWKRATVRRAILFGVVFVCVCCADVSAQSKISNLADKLRIQQPVARRRHQVSFSNINSSSSCSFLRNKTTPIICNPLMRSNAPLE